MNGPFGMETNLLSNECLDKGRMLIGAAEDKQVCMYTTYHQ